MKRPKVLLLNLLGIGRRSTSKMASLSSSQDIKAYCVNGHHGKIFQISKFPDMCLFVIIP